MNAKNYLKLLAAAVLIYAVGVLVAIPAHAYVTCGDINRLACINLQTVTAASQTINGTLLVNQAPSANSNTVNKASKITYTTPVDTTGTQTYTLLDESLTVGASSGGTNQINGLKFNNYTGNANDNVTAIQIGTSDGLGTAYGINIGAGWDAGINSASPIISSSDKADFSRFLGADQVFAKSAGTWTMTRAAEADYGIVHTAAANTSILSIDLTPHLRTTASKGQKLNSIDFAYTIGTLALNAQSATIDKICYANNVANAVTSIPLTGSLATATQANPYLSTLTVTTPAYLNTADCNYILELTVNAAATSAYTFNGVNLNFSRNDL